MEAGIVLAGKYRITRQLGEGGMGRVLEAVHLQLEQRVAIKMLLPQFATNEQVVARFLREARSAVKLRSEHIGRVIDVGTSESGTPFMVMEYLEGRDLEAELHARGRLPAAEAVGYILQSVEALAEAHAAGIVHRDVKPANLFLTKRTDGSPLIKVLDFGISKVSEDGVASSLTKTQTVMGSPGYMSPEQLRSTRDVDARTDIWALGVVLYELIAGQQPFGGSNFSEICLKVGMDPTPPLQAPGLPPGLDAIVYRCLEKDPRARFANVAELAAALAFVVRDGQRTAERIARVLSVSLPTQAPAQVATQIAPTQAPSFAQRPAHPAPTQPPHAQPGAPTTLSNAAGQSQARLGAYGATRSKRWPLLVGLLSLAGVAVVVAVVLGSGGDTAPRAGSSQDASMASSSIDAAPVAARVVDAGVAIDATRSAAVALDASTPISADASVIADKRSRDKRDRTANRNRKKDPKKDTDKVPEKNDRDKPKGGGLYDKRGPETSDDRKGIYDKRN